MPQLHPDMIIHQRYQLQRPLGRGGFSIVWLALDLEDRNNAVALKISLPDKDTAGEQPVRMENQHNTTRNLENQHLLRSREFFMVENAGCLVFDYMAGGTLHHLVRKNGGLAEREVAKLIQQLGGALQYLHEHALIHFDIKPENILIDAFGNYYLSDFDTASRLENSMVRVSRIYADTPQYRSPEHIRGAAELSEKVDIFAFGTTIFEVCEGILEKDYGIGTALISGLPKPPLQGNYAMRLENLIHACWNYNPSDRPTADALENYATHRLNKNFWPPIIEYKPDDSVLDDPAGATTGIGRDTVGRPTVVLSPSVLPPSNSAPGVSFRSSVTRWLHQTIDKTQITNPKSLVRKWVLPVLGVVSILIAVFFIVSWIVNIYQFSEKIKNSETLKAQHMLKDAYAQILVANKLRPTDSTGIRLRREILRMALEQHTAQLDLARRALKSKDTDSFAEIISSLESNKLNASILVGDDSTVFYLGILKAIKPHHSSASDDTAIKIKKETELAAHIPDEMARGEALKNIEKKYQDPDLDYSSYYELSKNRIEGSKHEEAFAYLAKAAKLAILKEEGMILYGRILDDYEKDLTIPETKNRGAWRLVTHKKQWGIIKEALMKNEAEHLEHLEEAEEQHHH